MVSGASKGLRIRARSCNTNYRNEPTNVKNRVLLVHDHYRSSVPSGENQVVEVESELLRHRGHQVDEFFRYNDQILNRGIRGTISGALSTPWNPFSARAIKKAVNRLQPDVVHVHNTFPLLSPAIFHAIGSQTTRVLTLHNYRLFCPAAIPLRDGSVCTECIEGHTVRPSLQHGCYRGSRLATLPLAFKVALHRHLGTWTKKVDAFIVLTEFQRDLMIKAGLPARLVHVKPNFYPGKPAMLPWKDRRPTVVFVGRLTKEKGVETLVRAWADWGSAAPELKIIGDGESKEQLKKMVSARPDLPIQFLGQLTPAKTQKIISQSRLLVLPSECYEGFPLVLREAFAFGTPVAVSDIGPLPLLVRQGVNGVLFSPGDARDLREVVQNLWNNENELCHLASGARHSFDTLYTEDVNYKLLMEIYTQATEVRRHRKR